MATIYLTCASDYEYHAVIAAFTNRAGADAHAAFLTEQDEGSRTSYYVESYEADLPPARRLGAWLVRVDATGEDMGAEYSHFGCEMDPTRPPEAFGGDDSWQASGRTRVEALRRAKRAWRKAQTAASSSLPPDLTRNG